MPGGGPPGPGRCWGGPGGGPGGRGGPLTSQTSKCQPFAAINLSLHVH